MRRLTSTLSTPSTTWAFVKTKFSEYAKPVPVPDPFMLNISTLTIDSRTRFTKSAIEISVGSETTTVAGTISVAVGNNSTIEVGITSITGDLVLVG